MNKFTPALFNGLFLFLLSVVVVQGASPLDGPKVDKILAINITDVQVKDENCGQRNGEISFSHSGISPFSYFINGTPQASSTITGLVAGNYTIRVVDGNGEAKDSLVNVGNTTPPMLNIQSQTNADCAGGGQAIVSSSDPTANAVWDSSPQQIGFTLSNVNAGTYTIIVTDSVNCQASLQVVIAGPPPMFLTTSVVKEDTCGAKNGAATVVVNANGRAPFNYLWDANARNQATQLATGLAAGTYRVKVTDADQCTSSETVNIPVWTQLTISANIMDASCFEGENGEIILRVAGGNGTYTYSWTPATAGNGARATGLAAGTYTVLVEDVLGDQCQASQTFTVGQGKKINLGLAVAEASACGTPDGRSWVAPKNTQGPYVVNWDTLNNLPNFTTQHGDTARKLYPGVYDVYVLDSAGCGASLRFVVASQNGLSVTVDVVQHDNCGLGQGIARADVIGGNHPLQYRWSTWPAQNSSRSQFATHLSKGSFNVVVSDSMNCVFDQGFIVNGNERLSVDKKVFTPEICEQKNGTAFVQFRGGTLPYQYSWSSNPPQQNAIATQLEDGFYRVIIQDSLKCKDTATIFVTDSGGFDISTVSTDVTCFGKDDGTAQVSVSAGAISPLFIEWNSEPPLVGANVNGLKPGAYRVTVTDASGCEQSKTVEITDAPPLIADFTYSPDTVKPVILSRATFKFQNTSTGAVTSHWHFGGGRTSTDWSPVYTYPFTGSYYVTLTVTGDNPNCTDTRFIGPFVIIDGPTVWIPNAFTPNGDGNNEELRFFGLNIQSFNLVIFNRWGKAVFTATDIADRWDGQLRSGKSAPEGIYLYKLQAVGEGNVLFEQSGDIIIIR